MGIFMSTMNIKNGRLNDDIFCILKEKIIPIRNRLKKMKKRRDITEKGLTTLLLYLILYIIITKNTQNVYKTFIEMYRMRLVTFY